VGALFLIVSMIWLIGLKSAVIESGRIVLSPYSVDHDLIRVS